MRFHQPLLDRGLQCNLRALFNEGNFSAAWLCASQSQAAEKASYAGVGAKHVGVRYIAALAA